MSATESEDYTSGENNFNDDYNDLSEFDADELIRAASDGLLDKIKLLIIGSEHEVRGEVGRAALCQAAANGHAAVVTALLEAGANVDAADRDGNTALFNAIENELHPHVEVVELLLEAGADVETCTTLQITPLIQAAENGDVEVAELLLEAGADVAATDAHGFTPLDHAAMNGHADIVAILLAAGANIEAADKRGLTALGFAANEGHIDIVRILIKAGAKLESETATTSTLLLAVFYQHVDVVRELLAAGADPDGGKHNYKRQPDGTLVRIGDHRTPLMEAIMKTNVQIVRILLEAGADPNIVIITRHRERRTALMIGAYSNEPEVVQMLLEAGADPFILYDMKYELSTGLMPIMALDFADDATWELLKREMNRRKAAALSVMPAQLPLYARQEIMRLAYSWNPSLRCL